MTIPEIVTLEQAVAHLNQSMPLVGSPGSPAGWPDLELKLAAATEVVLRRIAQRKPEDPFWIETIEAWTTTDASTSPSSPLGSPPLAVAPPIVRLAVLEQVAEMYRFRGDDAPGDRPENYGDLCDGIKSLLKAGGYLTETWA